MVLESNWRPKNSGAAAPWRGGASHMPDVSYNAAMTGPIIGITADNAGNTAASGKYESAIRYSSAVANAGGVPVVLPHELALAEAYASLCDGLVLTGGVDPDTTAFGEPMHAMARPVDGRRQAFELAVLDACRDHLPDKPVLGVCLGMQLMALHAGGRLNQYLPDTLAQPQVHEGDNRHAIELRVDDSALGAVATTVVSAHRQAVSHAGALRVVAEAPDGVIEAVDDPTRRFYVGVQWHPERGGDDGLNRRLFRRLIEVAVGVDRPATLPPAAPQHRRPAPRRRR